MERKSSSIKTRMCYQHDGTSPHLTGDVLQTLDAAFPGGWIGRGCPTTWSGRSTDVDFFSWDHMICLIYDNSIDYEEYHVVMIAVAADAALSKKCRVFLTTFAAAQVSGMHQYCWLLFSAVSVTVYIPQFLLLERILCILNGFCGSKFPKIEIATP